MSVGLSCCRCHADNKPRLVKPGVPTSTRCTYSTSAALNAQSALASPNTLEAHARRRAGSIPMGPGRAGASRRRTQVVSDVVPPLSTIEDAPANMANGAAPAPFALVISTATSAVKEWIMGVEDTTCSVMTATWT